MKPKERSLLKKQMLLLKQRRRGLWHWRKKGFSWNKKQRLMIKSRRNSLILIFD